MLSGLPDNEKESVWKEIEKELQQFETKEGFVVPCELVVSVGEK